ncbi:MAG: phage/plasmid replication domain-containing protein [Sarcina sp.]
MIHTAQFYINIENEDKEFLKDKYTEDISRAIARVNNIYENKGISINYITQEYGNCRIHFVIDFIKLLEKTDITSDDLENINFEIYKFIFDITGNYIEPVMIRLDYRLDVTVNLKEREVLMYLYNKTIDKYGFKKKYNKFETTIYYNSKSIQTKIYDKEEERKSKKEGICSYEKNILRFEVSLCNSHLNYNKRIYKMDKCLDVYLKESLYVSYLKNHLEIFIHSGDYYTIYGVRKKINSSNIKESEKEKLIEFLKYISQNGVTKTTQKYSKYSFKKYKSYLNELGINPILIPKNLKKSPTYIKNPFNICA